MLGFTWRTPRRPSRSGRLAAGRNSSACRSPPSATGFGHRTDDVATVEVHSGGLPTGYHDAVQDATTEYVERLTDADFAHIVDRSRTHRCL
jgi:hypothetical protein